MPHRKTLLIDGEQLSLALEAMALLTPHGKPRKNARGLSERKIRDFLQQLLGTKATYLSPASLDDAFWQIRLILRAHGHSSLEQARFNIYPLLQISHHHEPQSESPFHQAELKYFSAFAESKVTEQMLQA